MKFVASDYFVTATAFMLATVHFVTNVVRTHLLNVAGSASQAEALFNLMEANPLAEILMGFQGVMYVVSVIFLPAIILGLYYVVRKYELAKPYVVEHVAAVFFVAAVLNVLNDLSVLIGLNI